MSVMERMGHSQVQTTQKYLHALPTPTNGTSMLTRNLVLDYLAPVLLGVEYELRAKITRTEGRKVFVEATMSEVATSRRVVSSTALFLKVDVGHFLQGDPTGSFGQGSDQ